MNLLREAQAVVEPGLRAAVERLPEPVRTVVGYHFGWWDSHGRPTDSAGGKAIRPALALGCARVVGGTLDSAVAGAVAVELAHNFTLLHDDVMDGDQTRRHRPAVWTVFGAPMAILAGDALMVAAVEVLAIHPSSLGGAAVRLMCEALSEVVCGQSADLAFEQRDDVSLDECVAMAVGKTGALIGCACALGALLAGADLSQVRQLRQFGHHLGVAFQLTDDLLGIWGDPETTGKPVRSDLRVAKKSLPVVAALTSGTAAGRELSRLYLGTDPLDEVDLEQVVSLIEQAGGRAWARNEAVRQLNTALSCLAEADPDPQAAGQLVAVSQLITHRGR
ncbi:MAG: family 2 encapsulin nanocompartment cargo protein polyprenyl transferase [Pseudonocardiaceae bacterium]